MPADTLSRFDMTTDEPGACEGATVQGTQVQGEEPDARFRARDGVMACSFADGVALLDARSNTYFSLDGVGTVIWQALGGAAPQPSPHAGLDEGWNGGQDESDASAAPATLEQLCEAVVNEFEVTAEACRADIAALVTDLEAHGLCVREPLGVREPRS